jgi:hypothetical protein
MTRPIAKTTLTLAASFFFLVGQASADPWNKKTYVTFPNTVELPGRVMLPPGTYTMKLVDSSSNRYIVQVSNREENKTYAIFHTIPQYRDRPADDTIITFYETPGSAPRFIHTWYYPGDTIGREFTYSKERAAYIASLNGSKVPVTPETSVVASRETTRSEEQVTQVEPFEKPIVTEDQDRTAGGGDQQPQPAPPVTDAEQRDEPEQQPVQEEKQYALAAPPADEQAPEQQPAAVPQTLPSTASELPLIALSGIALIALGTMLRRVH